MSVLGIETATTVCGVALVQEGILLAERWVDQRSVHAERLLGFVDDVLGEASLLPGDLEGVAVSIGPGSFTGLRIGLSTAKGLSMASDLPLVAVPTLDALASRCASPAIAGEHVLAALDARRDEVYARLYLAGEKHLTPCGDVRDRMVNDLVRDLPPGRLILTGDAREKVARAIRAAGGRGSEGIIVAGDERALCSAHAVAVLGERLLRFGSIADPRTLEPLYIKEFVHQRSA